MGFFNLQYSFLSLHNCAKFKEHTSLREGRSLCSYGSRPQLNSTNFEGIFVEQELNSSVSDSKSLYVVKIVPHVLDSCTRTKNSLKFMLPVLKPQIQMHLGMIHYHGIQYCLDIYSKSILEISQNTAPFLKPYSTP